MPTALTLPRSDQRYISPDDFRHHVLMFDSLGEAHDPVTYDQLTYSKRGDQAAAFAKYDAYIKRILDEIANRKQRGGKVKVLFFFHGGLNSRAGALDRAAKDIVRINHDRKDIYPIFVGHPGIEWTENGKWPVEKRKRPT
jgi:hypothetical protein